MSRGYVNDPDLRIYGKVNLNARNDVLVDGPFIEEQKDLSIPFRGSKNQRILKREIDF